MPPTSSISGTAQLARRLRIRRETRARRPRLYAALVLLCLALLAAIAWPSVLAHLQSITVLDLVSNKPVPSPLRWLITGPVTTTELILPLPSGPIRARLYTPVNHPHASAMMVIHGVHYLGMNEPRLIAFATAMSSCGLRVLTPNLPDISDYHIDSSSIDTIGDSAIWLSAQQDHRPVGVMGLSFSGSLSLLAAAAPHFRPSIKFVLAMGSEDEMSRVADYYRTGEDPRPNGTEEVLPPHEYGALVLEYENLKDLVPPRDLGALRYLLRTHLYENALAERTVRSTLTPTQLAEARQLMDTSSPITRQELAQIEIRHIQDMAGVSPHGNLSHLTTPVYLLHGEADNVIPSAETQWLEADIPSQTLKASLISPLISHVNINGKNPSFADRWRLVHFFAQILHAAESP